MKANQKNINPKDRTLDLFANADSPAAPAQQRADRNHRAAKPPPTHATPIWRVEKVKERDFYGPAVTSPSELGRLFAAYLGRCPVEHFAVCLLTTHLRPAGLVTVSIGTIDMAPVWMPSVFCVPIIQGVPAIAVGHCHPSSALIPSRADKAITKKLVEAGKLLDIKVVDHIIVGGPKSWVSLAEKGLM